VFDENKTKPTELPQRIQRRSCITPGLASINNFFNRHYGRKMSFEPALADFTESS
jgi:hypothetical protein